MKWLPDQELNPKSFASRENALPNYLHAQLCRTQITRRTFWQQYLDCHGRQLNNINQRQKTLMNNIYIDYIFLNILPPRNWLINNSYVLKISNLNEKASKP